MSFRRAFNSVCLALCIALPATATDWYVDAVNGNNANGGTSPADAWRTITHAVAQTPATGVQPIHIAAGTYDETLGEQLPIQMRPDVQLLGEVGATRPRLASITGFGTLISMQSSVSSPLEFKPTTRIEGLELANSYMGIRLVSDLMQVSPTLRDLDIVDVRLGIHYEAHAAVHNTMTIDNVRFGRAQLPPGGLAAGLNVVLLTNSASLDLDVSDCTFADANNDVALFGTINATVRRCRMLRAGYSCASVGKRPLTSIHVEFFDCLFGGSDVYGCRIGDDVASTANTTLQVRLERCTVVDVPTGGVFFTGHSPATVLLELDRCVFFNSGPDLVIPDTSIVTDSLVLDQKYTGINGNFVADPLFVDPQQGDWRLRWGSPCIDKIDDAALSNSRDVAGHLRGVDGNLDRQELSDIGAFEFQPLELLSTGQVGTSLEIHSWGPQGNASAMYWTRAAPVAALPTPFGDFELDTNLARIFKTLNVGASSPNVILRHIPNSPQLVGQTFSFQALTDCQAAPLGRAFTNVVSVRIVL